MRKKYISKSISAVISVGLLTFAGQSLAYEAGDIIVRAGYANVSPNDSSDGIAVPVLGVTPAAATEAEVDSGDALGITATYMFSSSLGIELLAATPFQHDIKANLAGLGAGTVDAGETKHLPPTVSMVWYPLAENNSEFQPYLGLGVNYTTFFEEDVNSDLEALTGALAGAAGPVPLKLELKDSWGVAVQVGADYAINENWHVNASIRWIDINTEATFKSSAIPGDIITVDDVEINPFVYQINIGYTF